MVYESRWQGVQVVTLSLDAVHYHILGKFANPSVKPRVGLAKKHSSFIASKLGIAGRPGQRDVTSCPLRTARIRSMSTTTFADMDTKARLCGRIWTLLPRRSIRAPRTNHAVSIHNEGSCEYEQKPTEGLLWALDVRLIELQNRPIQ